jgi:putative tryptophan/tyrosine transport system substrate-binding protein
MRRRDFIAAIAANSAALWSLTARAQPPLMPTIGVLGSTSSRAEANFLRAFQQGLGEAGYVEGRNATVEYRWADDQNEKLPTLAADLVRRQVSVIVAAASTPAALTAKAATATIPIVFLLGSDPVAAGLVDNLARPGGNVTGVTSMNMELGPKRLELLRELLPAANVVALLVNPTNPTITQSMSKDLQSAAQALGVELHILNASTEADFDSIFAALSKLRASGLVIAPDALFISRTEQLAALTVRHAVPAIAQFRDFTVAGGLMSYGGSFTEGARQVGIYAGRILKGEKPADLPVQQMAKVELIINLKAAKALGLTIPLSLLGRADEVIE